MGHTSSAFMFVQMGPIPMSWKEWWFILTATQATHHHHSHLTPSPPHLLNFLLPPFPSHSMMGLLTESNDSLPVERERERERERESMRF